MPQSHPAHLLIRRVRNSETRVAQASVPFLRAWIIAPVPVAISTKSTCRASSALAQYRAQQAKQYLDADLVEEAARLGQRPRQVEVLGHTAHANAHGLGRVVMGGKWVVLVAQAEALASSAVNVLSWPANQMQVF